MKKMKTLTVRIDEATGEKLRLIQEAEGVSQGKIVRIAINRLYREYSKKASMSCTANRTEAYRSEFSEDAQRWWETMEKMHEILNTPWVPEKN